MSSDGVDLVGFNAMMSKLQNAQHSIPNELGRALYEEVLIEQKESMRRTPVDTGALRASHVTKKPEMSGRDVTVRIEVGGPAAPYAVYVHENVEAYHKVGQAKFLESTLLESRPFLAARVAKRVNLYRLLA